MKKAYDRLYSVSFNKDTGMYEVYHQVRKKTRTHSYEEFLFGCGLYNEDTEKYPNYIHGQVHEIQRIRMGRYNY